MIVNVNVPENTVEIGRLVTGKTATLIALPDFFHAPIGGGR